VKKFGASLVLVLVLVLVLGLGLGLGPSLSEGVGVSPVVLEAPFLANHFRLVIDIV
jgi:hypothetical protein